MSLMIQVYAALLAVQYAIQPVSVQYHTLICSYNLFSQQPAEESKQEPGINMRTRMSWLIVWAETPPDVHELYIREHVRVLQTLYCSQRSDHLNWSARTIAYVTEMYSHQFHILDNYNDSILFIFILQSINQRLLMKVRINIQNPLSFTLLHLL